MENIDTKLQAHLFICCHEREGPKPCCAPKEAESLVKELKAWIKNEDLTKQIRVSKSSCLGSCKKGIAAVLYPQNQWMTHVSSDDRESLKKLLKSYIK